MKISLESFFVHGLSRSSPSSSSPSDLICLCPAFPPLCLSVFVSAAALRSAVRDTSPAVVAPVPSPRVGHVVTCRVDVE